MTDPAVDLYNVRVGSQTFSPLYQFTASNELVETALAIRNFGSDIIKFELGPGVSGQYSISIPSNATNLMSLAKNEPNCRYVLNMQFKDYILWTYTFTGGWWTDGYSTTEQQKEYNEMFSFTRYLLTNYNNSGKTFYLGHWEGDGYLEVNNWTTNPPPGYTSNMVIWLNVRQAAVDDAKRSTAFTNVNVYHYTEANRVRDAMYNGPTNNQRMINYVVPYVTNLDYLSWSSYDGQNVSSNELVNMLNYMEAHIPTNKAATVAGKRLWVGEYGWGGSYSSYQQEPLARAYMQRLIPWGVKFILMWEMYNNEVGHKYWLIDDTNTKVPCYWLHQRFLNAARMAVARFKEVNGRVPNDAEFTALVTPLFDLPFPAAISLDVANGTFSNVTATSATVTGTLTQNVYGEDWGRVWVYWGTADGGTNGASWQNRTLVATNSHFNTAAFSAALTNLPARSDIYYRFYATNSSGESWAPAANHFTTDLIDPAQFHHGMRVTFSGYNRNETLANFPVLVVLNTNLPGFSYAGFASASGGDLRVADAGRTQPLAYEIDEWNTNGSSYVWVRMPALSGPSDAVWLYWGNAAATNPPATGAASVWAQDFALVWHLKEATFPFADSSVEHPALGGVAPVPGAAGIVGRAIQLRGSTDYLDAGTFDLGNQFTLSAWVRVDTTSSSNIQSIWSNKGPGFNADGCALFANSYQTRDGKLLVETGNGTNGGTVATPSSLVTTAQWHHVAAVIDRSANTAGLYVDGALRTESSGIRNDFNTVGDINLGRLTDGSFPFKGIIDEARIESTLRSSNWIWAVWMTIASNAVWQSYGALSDPATTNIDLISTGAVWRFLDNAIDQGTAWRAGPFDDSTWKSGPAQLGFGDGDEATLVASNNQWTTYFRRTFWLGASGYSSVTGLTAHLLRDDGAVVYVNGAEVWRSNMPTNAPITYSTAASTAISGAGETTWYTQDIPASVLVSGANVVAVEVHQANLSSSDISFDFGLEAIIARTPGRLRLERDNGLAAAWPLNSAAAQLYTTTNLAAAWSPATNQPVFSNGQWQVLLPMSTNGNRYFRLQSP